MAFEIQVPRLGWSMDEGVFIEWLKQDGEQVSSGEALFTIESEKAVQEVEAIDTGILRIPPNGPQEGDTVLVGAVLAYLVEADEAAPFDAVAQAASPPKAETNETLDLPRQVAIDRPRNLIRSRKLPAVSPRAARVAAELGVDWRRLQGSGRSGRIREQDVRAAVVQKSDRQHPAPMSTSTAARTADRTRPFTPLRKTIAERMMTSLQRTAPVTLTTTADATNLVNLREQFRSSAQSNRGFVPSYTDVIVKLAAAALQEHPELNSRSCDEGVLVSEQVHIGIAVDTEAGLSVPVIRDVASLSLRQISEKSRELIGRARARRLSAEELQGGTFTITNLGAFKIETFTPIINYPECAVLGLGCIHRQPVVVDDQVLPRDVIPLSLTFDHRVVDGAPAARFLDSLRNRIEAPGPWLMP